MIKLFYHPRHDELEAAVQEWLKRNPRISVTGMAAASSDYGHTLTLLWTEGAQPHGYSFATFFKRGGIVGPAVEMMEAEATQWMDGKGRPVQVAQSGNQTGVFMALLVE